MKDIKWTGLGQARLHVEVVPMQLYSLTDWPSEDTVLELVGKIAGECYNSSKDHDACVRRALNCVKNGHHSPWEHVNLTLSCRMDRGTSHAVVRHRHCAFQQSSTIYTKYSDGIQVIAMPETDPCTGKQTIGMISAELDAYETLAETYEESLTDGMPAGRARDVLPNALATNLIITTNFRELYYIIKRRQGPGDAVRMHCFACMLEDAMREHYPVITEAFDEFYEKHPL